MKYVAALIVTFSFVSGIFFAEEAGNMYAADDSVGNGKGEILDLPYEV